ncbi:redoxin domain-containing protein [Dehalogenimonas etheniformans]|uniref:Thioredoxin peroxidase n=3 Tax=Dehalogenimonas etheniformans TaxID=1536648 RepID=A0A2P5P851_9CHLR|nr:thioredoxin peroxidase [Dehalogenimonas etheniformans]QNT75861.1 redoxin domain-containing protein [Dehalogenimonas etheniformans]
MAQLRQQYNEFTRRGIELVAIGPEDPAQFAKWWKEHDMPFRGLADGPEHKVATLYAQKIKLLIGRMPALLIVDREGRIRYSHYGESMSDISSAEEVLSILDQLAQESPGSTVESLSHA